MNNPIVSFGGVVLSPLFYYFIMRVYYLPSGICNLQYFLWSRRIWGEVEFNLASAMKIFYGRAHLEVFDIFICFLLDFWRSGLRGNFIVEEQT